MNMPPELDPTMSPDAGAPAPDAGAEPTQALGSSNGEVDREGAMAKADLYKLANYSHKLFQQISDDDQMEAWVQAKITKAADYIASVYHYLEYEMKFSEYGHHLDNSDTLSEGQKMKIKELLAEAKDKMKELKKADAEKMKGKHEHKVEEGILSGGERPCTECGGTGMVYEEPKPIPAHVKGKVAKYNTMIKATKAAHKRMDGQMSPETEVDEEAENAFTSKGKGEMKVGDTKKTRTGELTKTHTGVVHKNTSYADDGEAEEKSGKGIKTHAKAKDAATKKAERGNDIKLPKHSGNTWGMKNGEKFGKKMEEAKEKKADKDYDGDGKVESDKDEVWGSRAKAAAKSGKPFKESKSPYGSYDTDKVTGTVKIDKPGITVEALAKMKETTVQDIISNNPGIDPRQPIPVGTVIGLNSGSATGGYSKSNTAMPQGQANPMRESSKGKPSAGLSAAKKSATVKKAKAGGDIGKPGKGFAKLAKKAGGGEKGEKIAAAAMWKNIKETTAYIAEKAKATKPDFLDMDKDSDKKEPMKKAVADKKKETVKESTDFSRMQDQLARLNRSEKPAIVESREVDQIRALTRKLLG